MIVRVAALVAMLLACVAFAPIQSRPARLIEAWTIGGDDADDPYIFDGLTSERVMSTSRGDLWIASGGAVSGVRPQIRIFDARGKFVRYVGRAGGGPGEFGLPGAMVELRDGAVAVRDEQKVNRILVYAPDGSVRSTLTLTAPVSSFSQRTLSTDPAGNFLLFDDGRRVAFDQRSGIARASGMAVVRVSATGRVLDTLLVPAPDSLPRPALPLRPPFWPRHGAILGPRGTIATFSGDRYVVALHELQPNGAGQWRAWRPGDPVRRIERAVAPVLLAAAERADWLNHERATYRERRLSQTPQVPAVKPAIEYLRFAPDGRLWVQVAAPSERIPAAERRPQTGTSVPPVAWRQPQVYDVFEPGGRWIGTVHLAGGEALLAVRGDTIWVADRLPSDTRVLRRYHLRWD
jgi:hypothetical protein